MFCRRKIRSEYWETDVNSYKSPNVLIKRTSFWGTYVNGNYISGWVLDVILTQLHRKYTDRNTPFSESTTSDHLPPLSAKLIKFQGRELNIFVFRHTEQDKITAKKFLKKFGSLRGHACLWTLQTPNPTPCTRPPREQYTYLLQSILEIRYKIVTKISKNRVEMIQYLVTILFLATLEASSSWC